MSLQKTIQSTAYTFCINVSDACNLRCDYCFNKNKTGSIMDSDVAINYLEQMYQRFPDGEKYFIDMSGKGEPLLALTTILDIANWCKNKQDEIKKEVLPQFVCNGTLLTNDIARLLQKSGILFGVSLDGDRSIHDKHRRDYFGNPTFDLIINNIKKIQFRDYIGCAATLTKDVFHLVETIDSLLPLFKTLSFRPARGDLGMDEESEEKWECEYERLSMALLNDIESNNKGRFLALMNGDDYFGKFLVKAIGNKRSVTRCDASISRFAIEMDGKIFPCPSCSSCGIKPVLFNSISCEKQKHQFSFDNQIFQCSECLFKYFCGGECPLLLATNGTISKCFCKFRQKLIALSLLIAEIMRIKNYEMYECLINFSNVKMLRLRKDPVFYEFLNKHSDLSFSDAKKIYDKIERRY